MDSGGPLSSTRAIAREEDVPRFICIQLSDCRRALPLHEREERRECLDGPRNAIASASSAQFDQIVGSGNCDEQISASDSPKFFCVHAAGDREDEIEGCVGIGDESIGIRHDPFALRIASRREIDRRGRNVDPGPAAEGTEVVTVAAAGVEDRLLSMPSPLGEGGAKRRVRGDHRPNRIEQRLGVTAIEKPPPRRHRLGRVAGISRAALLRLQQIDIAAARDVEGVTTRTDDAPLLARKREVATAHCAKELRHRLAVGFWPLAVNIAYRPAANGERPT